jgi:hypothetical protein
MKPKDYLSESMSLYTQAAIGEHVQVPLNMIFQGTGDPSKVAGVFQFQFNPASIKKLLCGGDTYSKHVLLVGDAFIRSKIVMESKHLTGNGIAAAYRDGFRPDEWIEHGKFLKGKF